MAEAAELLRARGVNGKPKATTSPETLAATYGLATVQAAIRWAEATNANARLLVAGLQGGWAVLPEAEAKPGDKPPMTPEERARDRWRVLKQEVRLRSREARRMTYRNVTDAEWDQLEADVEREDACPPDPERVNGAIAKAMLKDFTSGWGRLS